jgi:hypothetical protein
MLALVFVPALACPTEAVATSRQGMSQVFTGQAFDTCSAPSPTLLRAWRHGSPHGALGLYIGGGNRACSQSLLNRDYVRAAAGLGWRLLPLYVGGQAPCVTDAHARRADQLRQCLRAGPVRRAGRGQGRPLAGPRPGSPVYLDMEAYARDCGKCSLAVLRYTAAAWSRALHQYGYLSGFYSSADSGVVDLASLAATGGPRSRPSACLT